MANQMLGSGPDFNTIAINSMNQASQAQMAEQAARAQAQRQMQMQDIQMQQQQADALERMRQQSDRDMEQFQLKSILTAPNYYETDDNGGTVYEEKIINEDGTPKSVKVPKVLIPGGKFGQYIGLKAPYKASTGGQSGSYEITDKDAEMAADQIASGNLPPTIVAKYYSQRTGMGVKNTLKINEALAKKGIGKDPITGEPSGMDIGDYEQSYKQEQKNRNMYQQISNSTRDGLTLVKVADAYGNGKFKDWNKFLMNIAGRTGDVNTAKYNAAYTGYIDSISMALGPSQSASTDNRLKLAQSIANPAQSAAQIKAIVKENEELVANRKASMNEEGINGWRVRNGLTPKPDRFNSIGGDIKTAVSGIKVSSKYLKKNKE